MMKRSIVHILCMTAAIAACVLQGSCRKVTQTVFVAPDSSYSGRIQFALRYNPALYGGFYQYLVAAGLADTLSTQGPFTVFAITNAGFGRVYSLDPRPYIVPGSYPLSQIPLGATEVLTAMDGYKIFLTSYASGTDTVYTANGSLVQPYDQKATNGLIQVLQRTMSGPYYPTCLQYLNSNVAFATFAYAVKRAHLDSLLNDSTQAYSVLAPTNDGMNNGGFNLDVLSRLDPDSVARVVENHIIPGRYFLYDYLNIYQQSGGVNPISVTTLSGNVLQVGVDPVNFAFSFFINPNQPAYTEFYNPVDVPAGIGTVQMVSDIILP